MTEMHNPPHPGVSWDMDLRLSKALGTTPGSWYAMQANYDDCSNDLRPAHA